MEKKSPECSPPKRLRCDDAEDGNVAMGDVSASNSAASGLPAASEISKYAAALSGIPPEIYKQCGSRWP